jgi:citrate lyase beta subunit
MLEKATSLGADQAILDLEDSVAPTDKEEARAHVVAALMDDRWGDRMVSVRVNPVGSTDGILDLEAVAGSGRLETVVIPKVEASEDLMTAGRSSVPASVPSR